MTGYRFERLSSENLKELIFLYKSCFNLRVSEPFLKRKYNTQNFGTAFIGYLAYDEKSDLAAAYYGVFPLLLQCNDQPVLAAQSGDTMTHPKHQGKGLFVKLATLCYDLARREGIRFVFGFPNKNSYPGFINKLNWNHVSDVNTYSLKTGMLPFDKLAKRFSVFNFLYERMIDWRLRRYETLEVLPNSLTAFSPENCHVIHDKRFYQYKSYYKHYRLQLANVGIVFRVDGRLWIGDMGAMSKDAFLKSLPILKSLAKKLCCSSIQFSFSEGTPYDLYLKDLMPVVARNPIGVLMLDQNETMPKLEFQAIDFDTF